MPERNSRQIPENGPLTLEQAEHAVENAWNRFWRSNRTAIDRGIRLGDIGYALERVDSHGREELEERLGEIRDNTEIRYRQERIIAMTTHELRRKKRR